MTHANIDDMVHSANPDIRRLLGNEAEFGTGLGLDNNFAVKVIKAVGNYGEIYERNLGAASRLKIVCGLTRQIGRSKVMRPPDSDRCSSYSKADQVTFGW